MVSIGYVILTAFHYFIMCTIGWTWVLGADVPAWKMAILAVASGVLAVINAGLHMAIIRASKQSAESGKGEK